LGVGELAPPPNPQPPTPNPPIPSKFLINFFL